MTIRNVGCGFAVILTLLSMRSVFAEAEKNSRVLGEWSGSGSMTTKPFHAGSAWELHWDTHRGLYFGVYMFRKGEIIGKDVPQVLANQTEKGTGSAYVGVSGDFYLVFNAVGLWNAQAVAVP